MEKITYNFVKDQDGSLSFQSKINSFNLDHVVNKDIVSFYTSFSKYSYFDTGLLPLDGTGLLGIRTAGGHTQVIYQYKPGLYHINWGETENDDNYKNYYLAQPYRIVIVDFLNDDLLGARTFYSLEPAYHSGISLYHVNLPNINCKGYRGNGVGWICLYHNEDWTQLPFNERLSKALERCSGVEVYNDANMNETDGPRFYQQNSMPDYTYNPLVWQEKSVQQGFDWTLDPSNWISVLVKDKDNQGAHYKDGIQLTLLDAITGNYQAYYYDTMLPKPINAITRSDLSITPKQVTDWFIRAYNTSLTTFQGIDPYSDSSIIREQKSFNSFEQLKSSEETQMVICPFTEESIPENECVQNINCYINENLVNICSNCVENQNLVFAENTMNYYSLDDPINNLVYDNYSNLWYDVSVFQTDYSCCCNCGSIHISPWKDLPIFLLWESKEQEGVQRCTNCITHQSDSKFIGSCSGCGSDLPLPGSRWFDSEKIYVQEDEKVICQICHQLNQTVHTSIKGGNDLDDDALQINSLNSSSVHITHENILSLISQLTEKIQDTYIPDQEPF